MYYNCISITLLIKVNDYRIKKGSGPLRDIQKICTEICCIRDRGLTSAENPSSKHLIAPLMFP